MAVFTYTGEDANGEKITSTVTADDRFAVYALAREQGHSISSIDETSNFDIKRLLNIEKINYYLSRVKEDELVMMTRNLGAMLSAGLTTSRALAVMERQSKNPRLKGVIKAVIESINKGDSFNDALAKFPEVFSDLYQSMVRAGE